MLGKIDDYEVIKILKRFLIIAYIFVGILGTLAHFFYDWTDNNFVVGLITPVNESTWEHMKLIFFPMLIYSFAVIPYLKKTYPCIESAFLGGTIIGTASIPVLFYTYSGIIGKTYMVLDIGTFFAALLIGIISVYCINKKCCLKKYSSLLYVSAFIITLLFMIFTVKTPDLGIFISKK